MTKKLPYISHWHTGVTVPGFGPKFQLGLMEQYPLMLITKIMLIKYD